MPTIQASQSQTPGDLVADRQQDGAADQPDRADDAAAPEVGEAAAHHDPDAAGRVGGEREDGDLQRREPVLGAQELVLELADRGQEDQAEEAGGGQQGAGGCGGPGGWPCRAVWTNRRLSGIRRARRTKNGRPSSGTT